MKRFVAWLSHWKYWFLGTMLFFLLLVSLFFLFGTNPDVGPWIYVLF